MAMRPKPVVVSLVLAIAAAITSVDPARPAGGTRRPGAADGAALAPHRALPGRPHESRRRHSVATQRVLRRRRERRRLEDDGLPDGPGRRSSTTSPPDRSAPSRSRRAIRASSTSAAAKACSARTSPSATASTSPTDAGATWTHLGLRDGQQIPQIVVDPRNPNRLFVAVLGHPYGPNEERGIFRSTDGGQSFQKVLYKDADTGGVDLVFDPSTSDTVYAVLWQARQGPWENGVFTGPGSGVFKSTDGGNTWRPIVNGPADVRRRRARPHRHRGRAESAVAAVRDGRGHEHAAGCTDRTMRGETWIARQQRSARDRARQSTSPK